MGARRKFSGEYKREAVAMPDAPGISVNQISAQLGIGATVLARWQRPARTQVILPPMNTNGFWKRITSSVA